MIKIVIETELIEKIKDGDGRAFAELYNRYAEYALRIGTAVTRNSAWAADAVQETFIRIYNNISSFDSTKSFKPWFYTILINECNLILKKNKKIIFFGETAYDEPSAKDFHRFEEYEDLYRAIQGLNDVLRIPIILKYLNDLSEKDIASILRININTVKSRLFKGRQKLKTQMAKQRERSAFHG